MKLKVCVGCHNAFEPENAGEIYCGICLPTEGQAIAQPAEQVSPSATGCRGATAPSNPEADSSVRCRDKAESAAMMACEMINKASLADFDKAINGWQWCRAVAMAGSENDIERLNALRKVIIVAADAPPCGERARLDNDKLTP